MRINNLNKLLKKNMKMKINNLNKLIEDYEEIFDIVLDNINIYNIFYDIKIMAMANKSVGDTFCVKEKNYYKNGIGYLGRETIFSFNFEMTDETGYKQVVNYLGYNKD